MLTAPTLDKLKALRLAAFAAAWEAQQADRAAALIMRVETGHGEQIHCALPLSSNPSYLPHGWWPPFVCDVARPERRIRMGSRHPNFN